jgi:hypothetical protein
MNRNPKFEARSPEIRRRNFAPFVIHHSGFVRISFGFRISDFGYHEEP